MNLTRTHRPLTAGRKAGIILLAIASVLLLLPTAEEARAQQTIIPGVPLGEIDLPTLPTSADLSSLLGLLPIGLDLNKLDLLKGPEGTNGLSQLLGSLPINLFSPTFKITDEPGSWFDSGLTLFGGKSLAPVLKLPGIQTKATFIVGPETGADTNHSITSLIRPVGAAIMDQTAGFVGTRDYEFTEPGLYAFTCKIHPYMLGAAVVDDPLTVGLDFGKQSIINMYDGATVVPTFSDIIFRLVRTFFTATVPSNWQTFSATAPVTWDPSYPAAPDPHLQGQRRTVAAPDPRRVLPEVLPRAQDPAPRQPRSRRSPAWARCGSTPSSRRRRARPSRARRRRSTSRTGRCRRRSPCRGST